MSGGYFYLVARLVADHNAIGRWKWAAHSLEQVEYVHGEPVEIVTNKITCLLFFVRDWGLINALARPTGACSGAHIGALW